MKRRATRLIHPQPQQGGSVPTDPQPYPTSSEAAGLPHLGAVKIPLFASSTYVFENAQAGADTFAGQQGRPMEGDPAPFNYSRLGHPNLVHVEAQLLALDGRTQGEDEAVAFESGMAAITTTLLALLRPGALLVCTAPLYGGTRQFIRDFLEPWGVRTVSLEPDGKLADLVASCRGLVPDLLYAETPANPTNLVWDWSVLRELKAAFKSDKAAPPLLVDNTYLGPCWQHPLEEGADLVLYSATKSMSGHSDLVAGACVGDRHLIKKIRSLRNKLGNTASPFTSWLLSRSLETVNLRMQACQINAQILVRRLEAHPAVANISYPGAGGMIAVYLAGPPDHHKAWTFLNHLRIFAQAVSLGSNESLACHPASTTHSGITPEERSRHGILPQLVRLSVGIEDPDDLWEDLLQALDLVL